MASTMSCGTARATLRAEGGQAAGDGGLAAHVLACPACRTYGAERAADAALLRAALGARAPAHLGLPVADGRPLPHPALVDGRALPAAWLLVPAAAAAAVVAVGTLFATAGSPAPGLAVELAEVERWATALEVAEPAGPAGAPADWLLSALAPASSENGADGAEGDGR